MNKTSLSGPGLSCAKGLSSLLDLGHVQLPEHKHISHFHFALKQLRSCHLPIKNNRERHPTYVLIFSRPKFEISLSSLSKTFQQTQKNNLKFHEIFISPSFPLHHLHWKSLKLQILYQNHHVSSLPNQTQTL